MIWLKVGDSESIDTRQLAFLGVHIYFLHDKFSLVFNCKILSFPEESGIFHTKIVGHMFFALTGITVKVQSPIVANEYVLC